MHVSLITRDSFPTRISQKFINSQPPSPTPRLRGRILPYPAPRNVRRDRPGEVCGGTRPRREARNLQGRAPAAVRGGTGPRPRAPRFRPQRRHLGRRCKVYIHCCSFLKRIFCVENVVLTLVVGNSREYFLGEWIGLNTYPVQHYFLFACVCVSTAAVVALSTAKPGCTAFGYAAVGHESRRHK